MRYTELHASNDERLYMAAKDALKKLRDQRTKLLEAAKQKRAEERQLERQHNARRRDLLGSMALELMESGEWPKDRILSRLDQYLKRENDRALFEFPPRPSQDAAEADPLEPSSTPEYPLQE